MWRLGAITKRLELARSRLDEDSSELISRRCRLRLDSSEFAASEREPDGGASGFVSAWRAFDGVASGFASLPGPSPRGGFRGCPSHAPAPIFHYSELRARLPRHTSVAAP